MIDGSGGSLVLCVKGQVLFVFALLRDDDVRVRLLLQVFCLNRDLGPRDLSQVRLHLKFVFKRFCHAGGFLLALLQFLVDFFSDDCGAWPEAHFEFSDFALKARRVVLFLDVVLDEGVYAASLICFLSAIIYCFPLGLLLCHILVFEVEPEFALL